MRIALGIEYDGSYYHGWQSQTDLRTVQGSLEKSLSKVADHNVEVYCAGRTDTGVHGLGQVVHFDSDADRSTRSWIYGANSQLPKDIAVKWSKRVADDFHARHSALSRSYRYVIFNSPIRPALFRTGITWHYRWMDEKEMHKAAQYLLGEQDFSSFRSTECQATTPIRNITSIVVKRRDDFIFIDITANAFLHHMVRNIAGVLMSVGTGSKELHWVKEVLHAKDRSLAAETAPAYGLYFMGVKYPEEFKVPRTKIGPAIFW